MIPLLRPSIKKEDIEAVSKQLESGWLTGSGIVEEFEREFAKYIGAKYAVAVDNLTAGYTAVLDMLRPSAINLPSATYITMANIPNKLNMKIHFRDGWVAGGAYDILTDKGKIVDSAHALERELFNRNKRAIWLFSFHATKLLTTGKGGMIATDSKNQADFLKTLVNNGRIYANNTFEYVVHTAGWNFYMSDIEASLGLSQLKRLDKTNEMRDGVKKMYDKYLKPHPKDNWTRYIYQVWIENFPQFYEEAVKAGIQVSKHFNPIHRQPLFNKPDLHLPIAEEYANHLISIPFCADMKEEDVKTVSNFINNWRING
jgi:dTDP-4-amino-4,6-dideoxygalactose transaminase